VTFGGGAENDDDLITHSFISLSASFHRLIFYIQTQSDIPTDNNIQFLFNQSIYFYRSNSRLGQATFSKKNKVLPIAGVKCEGYVSEM